MSGTRTVALSLLGAMATLALVGVGAETAAHAASSPFSCTSGYSKSVDSMDISMYNATDQMLTLDPSLTGHYGTSEHWATQPPATIAPGQCAYMTGYESNLAGVLTLHAVYVTPDGDYVPFMASDQLQVANRSVFTNAPTFVTPSDYRNAAYSGIQNEHYIVAPISRDDGMGYYHHIALVFQGGKTASYSDSATRSSDGQVSAACDPGYVLRQDSSGHAVLDSDSPTAITSVTEGHQSGWDIDGQPQYQFFSARVVEPDARVSWTCDPGTWPAQTNPADNGSRTFGGGFS
jgi:hypothetical protein